jgi:hypothetical protein
MSGITKTSLKIIHREIISLNGNNYDNVNTRSIDNIKEITKRILTIPTSSNQIVILSGSIGAGAYIDDTVRYMRFTNLDNLHHIHLTFKNENDDEFAVKLENNASYIYSGVSGSGVTKTLGISGSSGLSSTFGDLTNIYGIASSSVSGSTMNSCDLELFIASS